MPLPPIQQTATQAPRGTATPPAPNTPAPTGVSSVPLPAPNPDVITTVPTTRVELEALRRQRDEISKQLTSAADRREDLARELRNATGSDRAGLEQRIAELDGRIIMLERDLASTGRLVTAARATVVQVGQPDIGFPEEGMIAIPIVFTIFVLGPIAIAVARLIWKRATGTVATPAIDKEQRERMQRLEQAVDAIAVEMERVSEGQRFVTKLLADRAEQADKARLHG